MKLIDSHCHFDFPDFDEDREAILSACQRLGIEKIIMPGVTPSRAPAAKDLCQQFDGLFYAVGQHPYWLEADAKVTLNQAIAEASQSQFCVAIGECGLDARLDTPHQRQLEVFAQHCQLAQETSMPLIIHSVKTHNELLRCIKRYPGIRGVVHAFSGSYQMAMDFIEQGFYLGAGGTITYERAQKTRDAFAKIPLEAILLETDAPDMPLQGYQGQRNSPQRLIDLARALAQLRNIDLDQLAVQTYRNTLSLFNLENVAGCEKDA